MSHVVPYCHVRWQHGEVRTIRGLSLANTAPGDRGEEDLTTTNFNESFAALSAANAPHYEGSLLPPLLFHSFLMHASTFKELSYFMLPDWKMWLKIFRPTNATLTRRSGSVLKISKEKYILEMFASFSICHELLQIELFSQREWCKYFS